jgi:DNA-binding MarR family transcriptional regulator
MSTDPTPPSAGRRALLFHASVVADLLDGQLDACLSGCRLSPREFEIATVLSVRGPTSPTDVANLTGVPAPSVSRVLAGLERAELVAERSHPTDRRSRLIELTPTGRTAFGEAQEAFLGLLADVSDALGDSLAVVDFAVRRLEWALRSISNRPIPMPLPAPDATVQSLHYAGPRLRLDDETEVLDYIEWIRARRPRAPQRQGPGPSAAGPGPADAP